MADGPFWGDRNRGDTDIISTAPVSTGKASAVTQSVQNHSSKAIPIPKRINPFFGLMPIDYFLDFFFNFLSSASTSPECSSSLNLSSKGSVSENW